MPPRLKSLLSALNQPVVALLPQGFGQHSVLQVLVVAGISDGRPWLKGSQAQLRKNLRRSNLLALWFQADRRGSFICLSH